MPEPEGQIEKGARWQVLLAKLHDVNSSRHSRLDLLLKRPAAATTPVRHEAQ